jgi:hypothetical protein
MILPGDKISQEACDRILSIIDTQAIEDMFIDERNIKDLMRAENGEIATDELVNEYKKERGVASMFIGINPNPK